MRNYSLHDIRIPFPAHILDESANRPMSRARHLREQPPRALRARTHPGGA